MLVSHTNCRDISWYVMRMMAVKFLPNTNYKLNGCDDAIDEQPKEVNTKWKITSFYILYNYT